jgi:hypothetical protein
MVSGADSPKRKPSLVQDFIARENIKRFEAQLTVCTDLGQRQTLTRLLEQAFQQLAEAEAAKRHQASP